MTMHQLWINLVLPLSPDSVYKETQSKSRSPKRKKKKVK